MRLKRVTVTGLFDLFDHDIPFADGENVAIVHGPNGFGKTVVLRMIRDAVSGEWRLFEQTPFSEFWLDFDDGSRRGVIRSLGSPDTTKATVIFRDILSDGTPIDLPTPSPPSKNEIDMVDRLIPYLPRCATSISPSS